MSSADKCIITAALAGATTMKTANPAVPYTTEEFVEEAYRCYNAGASVVHIHARDIETGLPTSNLEQLGTIVKGIHEKCPIVINLSTAIGIGVPPEERIRVVEKFKPEMSSLNTNSMNFAQADWKKHVVTSESVFTNTFAMLVEFAGKMRDAGTKPEMEVYDLGGMYNVLFVAEQEGLFKKPLHFQFVWGILGGCPLDMSTMKRYMELIPAGSTWSSCGVGPAQFRSAFHAAVEGGHIRCGLEDNTNISKGVKAAGSYEQVEKCARIAELAERSVATPDEAREILGLKGGPEI